MNPIGLTLPLQIGRNGYFDQSYDTLTQVKTNIINLLKTKKGERRMNPNFGSGLQEFLFEQITVDSSDIVEQIIRDQISTYIPNVTVNKVEMGFSNQEKNELTDSYILYIKIQFTVNNQTDTVNLTVDQTNI
jgi:phage baseplate assembly protein W